MKDAPQRREGAVECDFSGDLIHRSNSTHHTKAKPIQRHDIRLLCTVEETARLLSISRTAVYGQLRSGALRSVKVGGRRLIPRTVLDEFVESLLDES